VQPNKDSTSEDIGQLSSTRESPGTTSQAVAIRTPSDMQLVIYEPGAGAALVDELLADWTTLFEAEVTHGPKNVTPQA
jgi:hypothetical protein